MGSIVWERYRIETGWGVHIVSKGWGKLAGRYIAESFGWGGKRGYFKAFNTVDEAKAYVDKKTAPIEMETIQL